MLFINAIEVQGKSDNYILCFIGNISIELCIRQREIALLIYHIDR